VLGAGHYGLTARLGENYVVKFPKTPSNGDGFKDKQSLQKHNSETAIAERLHALGCVDLEVPQKLRISSSVFGGGKHALMTRFAKHGTLLHYLREVKGPRNMANVHELIKAVVAGVKCMHDHGYAHHDLYPENVLVFEENGKVIARVADFGEVAMLTDKSHCHGNADYKSHECFDSGEESPDAKHQDEYAIAITAFYILTGMHLSVARDDGNNKWTFGVCHAANAAYDKLDIKAKDFIGRLAFKDANKRMSLADALKHPFIVNPNADSSQSAQLLQTFARSYPYPSGVDVSGNRFPWDVDKEWFHKSITTFPVKNQPGTCIAGATLPIVDVRS